MRGGSILVWFIPMLIIIGGIGTVHGQEGGIIIAGETEFVEGDLAEFTYWVYDENTGQLLSGGYIEWEVYSYWDYYPILNGTCEGAHGKIIFSTSGLWGDYYLYVTYYGGVNAYTTYYFSVYESSDLNVYAYPLEGYFFPGSLISLYVTSSIPNLYADSVVIYDLTSNMELANYTGKDVGLKTNAEGYGECLLQIPENIKKLPADVEITVSIAGYYSSTHITVKMKRNYYFIVEFNKKPTFDTFYGEIYCYYPNEKLSVTVKTKGENANVTAYHFLLTTYSWDSTQVVDFKISSVGKYEYKFTEPLEYFYYLSVEVFCGNGTDFEGTYLIEIVHPYLSVVVSETYYKPGEKVTVYAEMVGNITAEKYYFILKEIYGGIYSQDYITVAKEEKNIGEFTFTTEGDPLGYEIDVIAVTDDGIYTDSIHIYRKHIYNDFHLKIKFITPYNGAGTSYCPGTELVLFIELEVPPNYTGATKLPIFYYMKGFEDEIYGTVIMDISRSTSAYIKIELPDDLSDGLYTIVFNYPSNIPSYVFNTKSCGFFVSSPNPLMCQLGGIPLLTWVSLIIAVISIIIAVISLRKMKILSSAAKGTLDKENENEITENKE